MDDLRRTEAEGLRVTWRLEGHHGIRILQVRKVSDGSVVVSFGPGNHPDLAAARELLPDLAKLWDAVRRDFWAVFIPPHPNTPSGGDSA
ncbi:hypothetical protein [Nocardia transvalensis]|uniref:hypothetical protein n=1 Tax=Nocardia transvalensis TaxID=37333 RepID=UPI001893DBB6|nr:hypothetical protein [Nocardia transvalensis]MBF6329097.1 hypothetical protein [Nocardia transvalensis]